MTTLSLRGLGWRPHTRSEATIADLDLEIPHGQRVLLAGAGGTGKSTVLRALAGLLDPEAGELTGSAPGPARAGERGLLLQNPVSALIAATVGRDAAFGPENAALPRRQIHRRAAEALEAARVDVDASRPPLETSGGQQQRIALAGALALGPEVLLLDEPTSMLDATTAAQVRAAILEAAAGRTLVVADHHLEPWLQAVDRVVLLGPQARVLADGPPAAMRDRLRRELEPDRSETADGPAPGPGPVVTALRDASIPRRGAARDAPPLLQGVDLELRAGTVTVVTGPSGAGKTTLLRALLDRAASVAYVPQDPEHSFVATTVGAEVLASPDAEDPQFAQRLLDRAGLGRMTDANPYRLSGGQQRRLAIVAALARRPRLLVLDEPTVGLDPRQRQAVLDLVAEAAGDGCAVVAASHDPQVTARSDAEHPLPAPTTDGDADTGPDRTIGPVPHHPRIPADALNPLTLCLIGILAAIGSFAVQTWQGGLLALLPLVLLGPMAVRSVRGGLLRMTPVLLSAAGLAWTTALLGDAPALSGRAWLLGATEAARITVFVAPGVLALTSVDVTALGDALGGRLRWPPRPVAASVAGLVRAGHLGRQWQIIMRTRTLRGLGSATSPRLLAGATLALLVDALRSAEQQAVAMDSRGFASATTRTWALPSPLRRADLLGVAIAVLLLVWPLTAELIAGS